MAGNIQVIARSRSDDSTQEALRERKAKWNDAVSELIVKLIVLKRGMNGLGDDEVGIPSSNIKDPLPNEVVVYLHSVADDYLKVMTEGNNIVQYQAQYSGSRRKSRREMPLAAFDNNELVARGGLLSSVRLFGLEKEHKAVRLNMIRFCDLAEHKLHDIDNFLTNSDENSLAHALIGVNSFAIEFINIILLRDLNELVKITGIEETLPTMPEEVSKQSRVPSNSSRKVALLQAILGEGEYIRIVRNYLNAKSDISQGIKQQAEQAFTRLDNLVRVYKKMIISGEVAPEELETNTLEEEYNNYLAIAIKFIAPAKSFQDLIVKIPPTDDAHKEAMRREDEEFEKLAHNVFTRWLKRKLLNVNPDTRDMMKMRVIHHIMLAEKKTDTLIAILNNKNTDPLKIFLEFKELAIHMYNILSHALPLLELRINEQKTITPPDGERVLSITSTHRKTMTQARQVVGAWIQKYGGLSV